MNNKQLNNINEQLDNINKQLEGLDLNKENIKSYLLSQNKLEVYQKYINIMKLFGDKFIYNDIIVNYFNKKDYNFPVINYLLSNIEILPSNLRIVELKNKILKKNDINLLKENKKILEIIIDYYGEKENSLLYYCIDNIENPISYDIIKYLIQLGNCDVKDTLEKYLRKKDIHFSVVNYLLINYNIILSDTYIKILRRKIFFEDNVDLLKNNEKILEIILKYSEKNNNLLWYYLDNVKENYNYNIIKYLIDVGCDINFRNCYNLSMLNLTINNIGTKITLDIVKLLTPDDINTQCFDYYTVLHIICRRYPNLEIIKYLVEECGADITIKNKYDKTSLDYLLENSEKNKDVIKYLKDIQATLKYKIKNINNNINMEYKNIIDLNKEIINIYEKIQKHRDNIIKLDKEKNDLIEQELM